MNCMSLSGAWKLNQVGNEQSIPAQVPGGVHTDLLAAGMIEDPFVSDHELNVMWVAEKDWRCSRSFIASDALMVEDRIELVCDGLDTLGTVEINGIFVGHFENMFRQYRWDVKEYLRPGENEVSFTFHSIVKTITDLDRKRPLRGVSQAIPGGQHVRKAPCQFGWDWGPMLPPIGLWKDLRLEGYSIAKISDVHLRQNIVKEGASLTAEVTIDQWKNADLQVIMSVTSPGGEVWKSGGTMLNGSIHLSISIPDLQLWWPNGYGEHPLYQVDLMLTNGSEKLDNRYYNVGFRTIELSRKPDQWGESFTFIVNGVPVFAKGADWIPADSFPTRISDNYLETLISSAAEANMNMLRVWGGGFYEEERFYDLCDRYGIMVWQDFIFACSIYPDQEEFFANVRAEALDNVRRLRHRASLAIWCGNNEMEQGWVDWQWNDPNDHDNQRLKAAYDRMFHHMLPDIVASEDPDRPYWPSSASSGIPFSEPNGQARGDCHYWDVWHGRKPFTAYRETFPRFMSEFGFQSLPPLTTIKAYAEEKDWNMTSYIMEHHQRSYKGNGLMIAQMTDTFRMPKNFPMLVYLSMLLQAEGIRYGVEHWRRHKNRLSGILYWQLNDCWPVASWSSIDYFGRWKALHYMARRFFAPILLSVEDAEETMGIWVTSDQVAPWSGSVEWKLTRLSGEVIESGSALVNLDSQESQKILSRKFHLSNLEKRTTVFLCALKQGEKLISSCVSLFGPNKYLELIEPQLEVKVQQYENKAEFTLSSSSLARFVEIEIEGADCVFSDNYFDIPAGETVQVTCPIPQGWTIAKVRERMKVTSLYNSFGL